jgi:hypothetical protein
LPKSHLGCLNSQRVPKTASLAFVALAWAFSEYDRRPLDFGIEWLQSSSFSMMWAIGDLFSNPFLPPLIETEKEANQHAWMIIILPFMINETFGKRTEPTPGWGSRDAELRHIKENVRKI